MADYIPTTLAPSPQALQARRLADLLQQKEAMGVEPIRSPWQGVGKIAQSIAGGYDQYQTDQLEGKARADAMSQILGAQGGDQAKLLAAAMNPYVPGDLAKTLMEKSFPARIPYQGGSIAVDPRTQMPIPGSFISEDKMIKQKAGDVETETPIRSMEGGGYSQPPVTQGGYQPMPTDPNAQYGSQTNPVRLNRSAAPAAAPPAGVVGTQPAAPAGISPQVQQLKDWAIRKKAEEEGATTTAKKQAEYFDSLHVGLAGKRNVAAQQKVNFGILRDIADSPDLRGGNNADLALRFQRMAASLGINPTGAAPRELFNQVAAKVLGDQFTTLKSIARETGEAGARIFKPMLDLEEKANIQPNDSIEGTKAKINLFDKMGDLDIKYGNRADEYIKKNGKLDVTFDTDLNKEMASDRIPDIVPQKKQAQQPDTATTITLPSGIKYRQIR